MGCGRRQGAACSGEGGGRSGPGMGRSAKPGTGPTPAWLPELGMLTATAPLGLDVMFWGQCPTCPHTE